MSALASCSEVVSVLTLRRSAGGGKDKAEYASEVVAFHGFVIADQWATTVSVTSGRT